MFSRGRNELLEIKAGGTAACVSAQKSFPLPQADKTHRNSQNSLSENCPKLPVHCGFCLQGNRNSLHPTPNWCHCEDLCWQEIFRNHLLTWSPFCRLIHTTAYFVTMPWTYCTRSASPSLYLTIVHRTKVTGYVSLSKPNYPLLVRNITSKDMSKLDQRGNESILSQWFAPTTNCSPCLPSNSTFQRAGTSHSPL